MPKILLVEDNEMNRDMLSRRLVRGGYEVTIAEDGARGVAMATSDRPDLILMDMSLPVIDGWEATRQIKATPELRKIPIIALTAHAMATDREKGPRRRLRRLRHKTDRAAQAIGQDRDATRGCGTVDDLQVPDR
jgi:CheY-like chemotaxis protein